MPHGALRVRNATVSIIVTTPHPICTPLSANLWPEQNSNTNYRWQTDYLNTDNVTHDATVRHQTLNNTWTTRLNRSTNDGISNHSLMLDFDGLARWWMSVTFDHPIGTLQPISVSIWRWPLSENTGESPAPSTKVLPFCMPTTKG